MDRFLVLITKHRFDEYKTTQFDFLTFAWNFLEARSIARSIYPQEYRPSILKGRPEGLVAYYTGEIHRA